MIPFSILDLCPIPEGGTAADAFRHSVDLAQHAEVWGYRRYWVAEHHNMPGIASAATSILIAHVAASNEDDMQGWFRRRVMLPNHNPLIIAEQFGTLGTLYPDRIDLGLGRAPGTDPLTARAPAPRCLEAALTSSLRMLLNCKITLHPYSQGRRFALCRAPVSPCRYGCSVPVCSARNWRRIWDCPSRSHRTSLLRT